MEEPLSELAEKCKSFHKSEKCDHKRMELCALMDFPPQNLASATQGILMDAAMPVLREEIKSPLSPFRYKDELEKALNDFHFGNMFMYGAQKVGGRMKHQKEWFTCDRCGKEIKVWLLCTKSITRKGILNNITYDLCNECMEDFERFMRNE